MTSRTKYAAALSLSLAAGFAIGWAFGMHGPQSFDGCSRPEVLPTEEQPSVAKARKGGGSAVSSSRASIVAELREEEARLAKEIAEIERGASGESKDNVGSLVAGYTFKGAKTLGEARVKAPQEYEDFAVMQLYRKACWGRGASKLREMMDKSGIDLSGLPTSESAAIMRLLEIKDRLAEVVLKTAAMGDNTATEDAVHAESEIQSLVEEMGRIYESARNSLISIIVKARAEKAGFSVEDAESIAESYRAIAETDMQVL